ncbi:MAG: hypothetical protein DRJ07_15015 [Bacteroidetes bacterium]|nr:MAG: hypothetical protein DRJ07_15015 [Bacteroidota bacterium]
MKVLSIISLSIVLFLCCKNQTADKNTATIDRPVNEVIKKPTVLLLDTIFSFNNHITNKTPIGWSQYFTGKPGEKPNWKIVEDNGNKVLAQLSKNNPNYHFNEIVFDGIVTKNVELKVKMKGVTGKMDQGGGFVWRFIDADNYYVVRANPLEDNVVLYIVKDGERTDLPVLGKGRTYGVDVKPLGDGWNHLKLSVVDNLFTVYLNDEQIFQVKDDSFTHKGKIGLWTKADAVTYFDDLQITIAK